MNGSDRWFRWAFNTFLFLMCFQLGMLLFLKSLFYQAERKMKTHEAEVAFKCGDFNTEEQFWNLPASDKTFTNLCLEEYCPESLWMQSPEQDTDLHILAVNKARPSRRGENGMEHGHFVNVQLKGAQKETVLVLVSQGMLQWNLQDANKEVLKEVLVVGSDLVWVDGLPEGTKLTYFSKDQLCSYPVAWEEIKNPQNEFRRLLAALKEYTGLNVTSFQGKEVGRVMRIPFTSPLLKEVEQEERQLASATKPLGQLSTMGLQWERTDKNIQASHFIYNQGGESQKLSVPMKARDALWEPGSQQLFVIDNHQFGVWQQDKKQLKPLYPPLTMAPLYWPTALTFNPMKSEIYIYNDDHGGEILSYNVVTKKWGKLAEEIGYSLVALHYDRDRNHLVGTRFQGRKLVETIVLDGEGKLKSKLTMSQALDFSKTQWRAKLLSDGRDLWLKVTHPAHPGGDLHSISLQPEKPSSL